jgi:hypothetical protein
MSRRATSYVRSLSEVNKLDVRRCSREVPQEPEIRAPPEALSADIEPEALQ